MASAALVGQPVLIAKSGDVVSALVGPLDCMSRSYTIALHGTTGTIVSGSLPTTVSVAAGNEVAVASINFRRFFDATDDPAVADVVLTAPAYDRRLAKASVAIRGHLRNPDIVGVQEVETLGTMIDLAARIAADGGPGLRSVSRVRKRSGRLGRRLPVQDRSGRRRRRTRLERQRHAGGRYGDVDRSGDRDAGAAQRSAIAVDLRLNCCEVRSCRGPQLGSTRAGRNRKRIVASGACLNRIPRFCPLKRRVNRRRGTIVAVRSTLQSVSEHTLDSLSLGDHTRAESEAEWGLRRDDSGTVADGNRQLSLSDRGGPVVDECRARTHRRGGRAGGPFAMLVGRRFRGMLHRTLPVSVRRARRRPSAHPVDGRLRGDLLICFQTIIAFRNTPEPPSARIQIVRPERAQLICASNLRERCLPARCSMLQNRCTYDALRNNPRFTLRYCSPNSTGTRALPSPARFSNRDPYPT